MTEKVKSLLSSYQGQLKDVYIPETVSHQGSCSIRVLQREAETVLELYQVSMWNHCVDSGDDVIKSRRVLLSVGKKM